MKICPNCGEQTSAEFKFCQKCGAEIGEKAEMSVKSGKLPIVPKKIILFGGIFAIGVLAVILITFLSVGSKGEKNYGLYMKDREIYYTDFSDKHAIEITSRLLSGEEIYDYNPSAASLFLGREFAFSSDGKRLFYPDKLDSFGSGISLYYRDINKPEKEPSKIDSNIIIYSINEAGNQVIYIKGSEGNLYLHDLTEKEKIASGVVGFKTADDCKRCGRL
ncbi:zinc-ribbon domain-containing protein [Lachnoclostridium edouardi]|uniref:zinc-ribbon domain-containing protein n=1 Tax=Lachnoclostridium edouardi TaxID=1926283 RepID=UPI000C7E3F18|nr:zinc-ribbon domain-containing protein [Lachnoclostridium edouardi]